MNISIPCHLISARMVASENRFLTLSNETLTAKTTTDGYGKHFDQLH